MAKNIDRFTYRVTWSEEDQEHVGLCAEFPSLSWLAPTPEKALVGIRRLVKDTVSDLENNGEPVPEPIALKTYSGKFMVRVPPEMRTTCSRSSVGLAALCSAKMAKEIQMRQ